MSEKELTMAIDSAVAEYRSAEAAYRTQAFISTLAAAGFAVVPVEATDEMEVQGGLTRDFDAVKMPSRKRAALTWAAMVAAASKP